MDEKEREKKIRALRISYDHYQEMYAVALTTLEEIRSELYDLGAEA